MAVLVGTASTLFAADLATKTWIVRDYADGHVTTLIPHILGALRPARLSCSASSRSR